MTSYNQIVVALELADECDNQIINKAKLFADEFQAQITLVHAVEQLNTYGAAYAIPIGIDVQESIINDAQMRLESIGRQLKVPKERQIVEMASAKFLILETANKINANMIILGSHGRHGLQLLLGSTANAVLHHAKCDVLAVRVQETTA